MPAVQQGRYQARRSGWIHPAGSGACYPADTPLGGVRDRTLLATAAPWARSAVSRARKLVLPAVRGARRGLRSGPPARLPRRASVLPRAVHGMGPARWPGIRRPSRRKVLMRREMQCTPRGELAIHEEHGNCPTPASETLPVPPSLPASRGDRQGRGWLPSDRAGSASPGTSRRRAAPRSGAVRTRNMCQPGCSSPAATEANRRQTARK